MTVVLVPFSFSDQTITKKRPADVLSSDAHNNVSSHRINFGRDCDCVGEWAIFLLY